MQGAWRGCGAHSCPVGSEALSLLQRELRLTGRHLRILAEALAHVHALAEALAHAHACALARAQALAHTHGLAAAGACASPERSATIRSGKALVEADDARVGGHLGGLEGDETRVRDRVQVRAGVRARVVVRLSPHLCRVKGEDASPPQANDARERHVGLPTGSRR